MDQHCVLQTTFAFLVLWIPVLNKLLFRTFRPSLNLLGSATKKLHQFLFCCSHVSIPPSATCTIRPTWERIHLFWPEIRSAFKLLLGIIFSYWKDLDLIKNPFRLWKIGPVSLIELFTGHFYSDWAFIWVSVLTQLMWKYYE